MAQAKKKTDGHASTVFRVRCSYCKDAIGSLVIWFRMQLAEYIELDPGWAVQSRISKKNEGTELEGICPDCMKGGGRPKASDKSWS
jgi:hypothetical protein